MPDYLGADQRTVKKGAEDEEPEKEIKSKQLNVQVTGTGLSETQARRQTFHFLFS